MGLEGAGQATCSPHCKNELFGVIKYTKNMILIFTCNITFQLEPNTIVDYLNS